jgi:hypothetical protein
MATAKINDTMVGRSIASNGKLVAIRFTKAQTGYRGFFRLIDGPRTLFSIEPSTCWVSPTVGSYADNELLSGANIPFYTLTVDDVPKGSLWEVDYA